MREETKIAGAEREKPRKGEKVSYAPLRHKHRLHVRHSQQGHTDTL